MKKNGYTPESYVLNEHSFYTYDSRKRPPDRESRSV